MLPSSEVDALVARWQKLRDVAARNRVVEHNLGIVGRVVSHVRPPPGLAPQDLYQEGARGLMRACDTYQSGRGASFGTYAHFWVRSHVQHAICVARLAGKTGTGITRSEFGADVRVQARHDCLYDDGQAQRRSIEVMRMVRQDVPIIDAQGTIPSPSGRGYQMIRALEPEGPGDRDPSERMVRVREAVALLGNRARAVVEARMAGQTLQQVADAMDGISRERVRQLEAVAYRQIRAYVRDGVLPTRTHAEVMARRRAAVAGIIANAKGAPVSISAINAVYPGGPKEKSAVRRILKALELQGGITRRGCPERHYKWRSP